MRFENGTKTLDGTSFAISEDRSQQGCTHQDIGGREQCRRRIRKCSWSGRNEAIRTVIRLRAGYAGMLAIRGDILARAMLGRKNTDRSQEKQGKAGEESGTGSRHSPQISSHLSEVKRGTAFRARHRAVLP